MRSSSSCSPRVSLNTSDNLVVMNRYRSYTLRRASQHGSVTASFLLQRETDRPRPPISQSRRTQRPLSEEPPLGLMNRVSPLSTAALTRCGKPTI